MPITIGAQLGAHEITGLLGKGGMGEVYRARDTKLKREVAIKVLPDEFSRDPDRLNRFQREAEVLASLNHPNIAAIYDLDEADGSRFLVLELVEGETLADRLQRGPIPLDEALDIAKHICDALEAAHERGIVHRDLKPANIKITPDGKVKVLDFGLARALEISPVNSSSSNSPTLSMLATNAGIVLGTAAYMSPEQAKGRPVDRRTDIFAFGCVLYEMLTGRRAFDGEDVPEILSRILQREPDWALLPSNLPQRIRELLHLCLEKNAKNRRRDAGDVRVDIEKAMANPQTELPANVDRRHRRISALAVITFLAGIILTLIAMWTITRFTAQRPAQSARFTIVPPPPQPLALQETDRDIAITPDGSHIVYRAGTGGEQQAQLAVRSLDQLDARVLAGINGIRQPFISPDSRWVGFVANNELKKVSISGGPAITLCRFSGNPRGASWGSDDAIIFATSDAATGLLTVPAGGGDPKALTKPDRPNVDDEVFPSVLPGGRGVLFTILALGQPIETAQVAVLDLKTGGKKILIRGASHAEYVDTGHLIYAAAGTLRAVRFDLARLEVVSDPVTVVEQVMTSITGAGNFAVSRTGALVYVPGGVVNAFPGGGQRSLVWVNRQGREEPINAPPRAYLYPRISPDGTRVALELRDQEMDIWIWDLMRRTLTRLTFESRVDQFPVWTPDSRRVIFSSSRDGVFNLYWQAADNTGTVERLTTAQNGQNPTSISPDGKLLVFNETVATRTTDINAVTLDGKREVNPLIHTKFREENGEISPDGRWIAYQSDESGQSQVHVRSFPNVDVGHWQVSSAGGNRPLWFRSGRELFYVDDKNTLMAVPLQTGGQSFRAGIPAKVFDTKILTVPNFSGRTYDVSPDGQRFLIIKDNLPAEQASTAAPASMVVVLNWLEELKARAGAK